MNDSTTLKRKALAKQLGEETDPQKQEKILKELQALVVNQGEKKRSLLNRVTDAELQKEDEAIPDPINILHTNDVLSVYADRHVIIGRKGSGKTTFMTNLCLKLLKQLPKHDVWYISYSETAGKLLKRFANMLNTNYAMVHYNEQIRFIAPNFLEDCINNDRLSILGYPHSKGVLIENIKTNVLAHKKNSKKDLIIFIDEATDLLKSHDVDSVMRADTIPMEIKELAQENNVFVFTALTVNPSESAKDKPDRLLELMRDESIAIADIPRDVINEDDEYLVTAGPTVLGVSHDANKKEFYVKIFKARDHGPEVYGSFKTYAYEPTMNLLIWK